MRAKRFTIYKAGEAERASYLPASTSPIWRRMPQGRISCLGNLKLNCMKQIILQFACEECDFKGTNEKLLKQHKRISALRRLILKELPNSSSTSDRATGELILFLHNINRPATVESLQNLNSVRTWHQAASPSMMAS